MVGTPSKGYVSDKFHARFFAMQPRLRLPHTMISGKPIDLARNVMVTKALQENCEYVFFLDSDILVNPDTLLLHQVNMPIVSAVYYSHAPPYEMVPWTSGLSLLLVKHVSLHLLLISAAGGGLLLLGLFLIKLRLLRWLLSRWLLLLLCGGIPICRLFMAAMRALCCNKQYLNEGPHAAEMTY
jgi:glycosyltransferase involved in cell wall biosynthesis